MTKHRCLTNTKRPYQLRARAAGMDRTRERITRAAVELHRTIGPAATTMRGVAERAGVTRATLYRHFANEEALFAACSADWLAANPSPDITRWALTADPVERLGMALDELYAYYRATEQMRANLLRDIDVLPQAIQMGITAFPASAMEIIVKGWPRRGNRLRRAVLGHAIGFETWRSLSCQGVTDREAASLMIRLTLESPDLQERPAARKGQ